MTDELAERLHELGEVTAEEGQAYSARRGAVSDPREIAGLVLSTPGLVDKLAAELAMGVDVGGLARATVVLSLVELANEWPGPTGWAIDNNGDPYPYVRAE